MRAALATHRAPPPRSPAIGGLVWVHFERTPSMPTYLVAFVVSELRQVPTSDPNINVWVRDDAVHQAGVAAAVAPRVIRAMEAYTGRAYPLPKLDLVAVPNFAIGAMENWGLATFL